ncbi:ribosome small subunit-dependent GTPase A [Calderihabitans maritimus]|uniref:Small ribosomal subunit biogenesis GTPase RsgA n=1 Tax=Calderihabitans maritimus TaxID=1246530 RepID=A0A1Z5HPG5_9FIRM|nr:ribosome small subunit-dependent GTPase A [Calderihabitans maritimus]GAW91419.1 ribosome small subunit-dependent GTPase A [Calderihabitans maritimus]
MQEGIVIKRYGGFYYVKTGSTVRECKLRGRFRRHKKEVIAGDRVKITVLNDRQGVIEEVLPRETELIRPPVANVEQAVIVMALTQPEPDLVLLDRLLILAEAASVTPLICFNKSDLTQERSVAELYAHIGYRVIVSSVKTGEGLDQLKKALKDTISVFAGPSGVGKSSLLNAVEPGLSLKTGQISRKAQRGRHTTRHVELLELSFGGLVADTPGFSRLNLPNIRREEFATFFPEMDKMLGQCRFSVCLHYKEPDCAVKEAVSKGTIDAGRYSRYRQFLEEIIENERKY